MKSVDLCRRHVMANLGCQLDIPGEREPHLKNSLSMNMSMGHFLNC